MGLILWADFFDDLENVRGRSRNTVMAYRRDLGLFVKYGKPQDILGFYQFMGEQGLSSRSQARVISSLRTYFKFLESRGKKTPELRDLKSPRIQATLPKPITMDDFKKLYEACEVKDIFKTARNKITLLLLYGLGCRVTELIDLNLSSFSHTDGWLKVLGKGEKERLVPLTEGLMEEFVTYLKEVRPHLLKTGTDAVLLNDRGKRPSRTDIWRWLSSWSKEAGLSIPISPHKFRHGCATALLESGANLRSIQMLLGHANIQTTQIYTSVTTEKMKQTIDEFHPLSSLDVESEQK